MSHFTNVCFQFFLPCMSFLKFSSRKMYDPWKKRRGIVELDSTMCFPPSWMFSTRRRASISLSFSLCLYIFIFVSLCLSESLPTSTGWTMPIFLSLASLHHYRSMLRFSFSSLLPECALLHSKSFDVNGNSWLREIWWKVSQPVFIPSQMALNKLREKTQIHFSQKGLI